MFFIFDLQSAATVAVHMYLSAYKRFCLDCYKNKTLCEKIHNDVELEIRLKVAAKVGGIPPVNR